MDTVVLSSRCSAYANLLSYKAKDLILVKIQLSTLGIPSKATAHHSIVRSSSHFLLHCQHPHITLMGLL